MIVSRGDGVHFVGFDDGSISTDSLDERVDAEIRLTRNNLCCDREFVEVPRFGRDNLGMKDLFAALCVLAVCGESTVTVSNPVTVFVPFPAVCEFGVWPEVWCCDD